MGYARMGVAVVDGGADGDDDAGGSPVAVSADPSVRGRARNPRITKWTSIATNVPELSISATYSPIHNEGTFISFGLRILWRSRCFCPTQH